MPNGDKSTGVATDPPSAPPQQIDYSSFAHLTCDTIEAKRNQAKKIKQRLLEMDSQEELTAIKQELGDRFYWVWRNLLTKVEQERVKAVANSEQLNLLAGSADTSAQLAKIETTAEDLVAQEKDDLSAGTKVHYIGNDSDFRHLKQRTATLTVVGLAFTSLGERHYDMITCRLPGGKNHNFLRNTLKKAAE